MCLLKIAGLSVESIIPGEKQPLTLLNNIHLDIKENQITTLIGESGAGKTILAKTISALLPGNVYIAEGNFFYRGEEVSLEWLKQARAGIIFYSPQNAAASFNPVIKIKKQIAETTKISQQALIDMLKFLDIAEPIKLLNSYPFELSEGENQRALLALAIAIKPGILVLDEPTSALDSAAQQDFMKLIEKIRREYLLSILLITHNLAIVENIADYIYIILNGEIVEEGTPEIIFKNPVHPYTKEIGA